MARGKHSVMAEKRNVIGLQSTIDGLQRQLKDIKLELGSARKEVTRLRHVRFFHLVETKEVAELAQTGEEGRIEIYTDQIIEYDETGNVLRLHSIP